jgi:hypothetical protein
VKGNQSDFDTRPPCRPAAAGAALAHGDIAVTTWPKDTQAARNAFYGDPGKGEIEKQLVDVVPPFKMYYEGKKIRAIRFHRKAAPALQAALDEVWDFCEHSQAKVDASGASKYFGAYNHRMVRGSKTKWSNHAYGTAIDLNALENALGQHGNMPAFIVDAFCRQGAMWGGWYKSRPDWMHFEFVDNGGHKPRSERPVWPKVAKLLDEPAPPTEVLEDNAEDEPADAEPAPADDDAASPVLLSVQNDLKAMNYNPGLPSGKWGGMTAGAIAGFINDRPVLPNTAPASMAEYRAIEPQLLAEIARAKAEPFTRPVTEARAKGDPATVAAVAPESVPVKRSFWAAVWLAITSFIGSVWDWITSNVGAAWDFFTDHKDDLPSDPGVLHTAWSYVAGVPPIVWGLAICGAFVFLAVNLRSAGNKITQSVSTGARQ